MQQLILFLLALIFLQLSLISILLRWILKELRVR